MTTAHTARAGLFMVTRFPQPGKTKTRLIPALGPEGAAQLQQQMTEYLLARFQDICDRNGLTFELHYTGGSQAQMRTWLGPQVTLKPQCNGDLGQRLDAALTQGFTDGLQPILIVGSDCPGIEEAHILDALATLASRDVVIGPAEDGGYYLLGLNCPQPTLFENIRWGESCVLTQTIAAANRHQLSVQRLSPLPDIDRPEDLPLWAPHCEDFSSKPQVLL